MKTMAVMAAEALSELFAEDVKRLFGSKQQEHAEQLEATAQLVLECLAKSDALYHDLEHTFLVTLVGREILRGRTLRERLVPADYTHLVVACLLHDIGYVRGILKGDGPNSFVVDAEGRTVSLPRGASDAALAPYHVDRAKLFAREWLETVPSIDAERVAHAIECTRFPVCQETDDGPKNREGRLVQAADLIGQLGDPLYLRKANALFYEFAETGLNEKLGYTSPADLVDRYPEFYWNSISAHLGEAIDHLSVTVAGRQWIANLHGHVFCAEHACSLMGPQRCA